MNPTQRYRRPWVFRDHRTSIVVIPERIFPPYEPPLQPWWREVRVFPYAAVLEICLSLMALGLALAAFRLLLR